MIKNKKALLLLLFCVFFWGFEIPSEGMTSSEREKCQYIIHSAATAAATSAALLSQLPSVDNMPLMCILSTMTVSLGMVFDANISEHVAKQIATKELSDFLVLWVVKYIAAWTIGWLPFFGNAINASLSFALVEGGGWNTANLFDNQ